jgi:DNA-binding response OmpR family regulator
MGTSVPSPEAATQIPDKVIFVVDDDEQIGLLLTQLIHQETPHHAWHHTTASQTLQAISTQTPHLLILDYDLPYMNGLELHDRLHALERLRTVPTLLISAIKPPMEEVRKRAITFLAKPLDLLELLGAIRRLLR